MRSWLLSFRGNSLARRLREDESAAQIMEFALSLPLLVVFVIGIFDFSGAVALKQKLTNAAREAARVAAADPANDLGSHTTVPVSVYDAFWVVDNYLLSENISDCNLPAYKPQYSSGLTWVSIAISPPCGLTSAIVLTINRGCTTPQTIGPNTVNLVATCVTIEYPYHWKYSSVAWMVGRFTGPTSIKTTATAYNEN